jgi:uncharacterized protein YabN with tetrapyrrole methylase and pyrophosphatase domain
MAKRHDHVYGKVVNQTEDGKTEKWEACRICGKKKPAK